MKRFNLSKCIFSLIGYTLVTSVAMLSVLPFLLIVSGSFSSEDSIYKYGYQLIPKVFSLEAYKLVFSNPKPILYAYIVTISVTVIGTATSLFLTSMTAYVIQKKELRSRNLLTMYFFFTTLFSGGLVPWYILMTKYLHFTDKYTSMIIPLLFNVFYIIVMKSFLRSIPDAVVESAKIDGAGEFGIFIRIVLPLSKPALATIGMFTALAYWNDWYNAMLFVRNENLYPLQYFLYKLLSSSEFASKAASLNATAVVRTVPLESFKLAMTIVTAGPILFLYPFIQKYFVKGLTIGAVKG